MTDRLSVDICVVGAGSAGLSVAAGASQLGRSTVLVERGRMGGDCLNTGCVPSKSLLAAAKAAEAARHAAAFGVILPEPQIDFAGVRRHVRAVIDAIAPNDSTARFTALGVTVIAGEARFTGPGEIAVGERRITARRFVLATGSRARVPPIPGLDRVPYLTNDTVFELDTLPDHLAVIGGGPLGLEMALAHRRLGSRVTVIEAAAILAAEDPELVEILRQRLRAEQIEFLEATRIEAVAPLAGGGIRIDPSGQPAIEASHLLVAAGRRPDLEALDLAAAGIAHDDQGITVDHRLRTTNRRVFAMGDIAAGPGGGPHLTHVAGYHAGIVIRNALFRLPARVDYTAVPRVTYTSPELAQVGLTEAEARAAGHTVRLLRWSFHENDRAQAERAASGMVKIVATPRGRVLGAGIVGAGAGELIQLWTLVLTQRLKLSAVANAIAPYPTLGEASKRAAGGFYLPALFSDRTRRLVGWLARLG